MGNRTIQAKILKIKRYKRLAPKKYYADQVTVHMPRHPEFFGNVRTLYLQGTTSHQEAVLRANALWMQSMFPSSCFDPLTGERGKDNEPRKAARRLAAELIDSDVSVELSATLRRDKFVTLIFMTNVAHDKNYFIEENRLAGFRRRSQSYSSRYIAMVAHRDKKIKWGQPTELPPEAGVSPSG